jgi:hypothetical protein
MVSNVVKDLEAIINRVVSEERSFKVLDRWAGSMLETK